MRHDAIAFLEDIRISAQDAILFSVGLDLESYRNAEIVRAAVERKLMIVGEALAQLAKVAPEIAQKLPEWRAIIAFRNIIVHGYRTLDHARVHEILQNRLPQLRDAAQDVITMLETPA